MDNLDLTYTAPLTYGEDGTIRIRGSRVTLDSILHAFQQGATAEQIQDSFPSVLLRDIYGAIAYYLEHREQWTCTSKNRRNRPKNSGVLLKVVTTLLLFVRRFVRAVCVMERSEAFVSFYASPCN